MSNIPKRNLAYACHLLKKKLINLHGGLLDVTTNIYLKSCAYHPDSECCTFFHGNLSDLKSSEDTLLYLYVIWNMLSRLIYMKLYSHRSFVINIYVITMAWHCISPWSFYRSLQKRREIGIFRICQQISAHSEVKTTEKKKRKTPINARKHRAESINRNLSAAVIHVKPSCNNSNLNHIGISLQRADSGSYHFLVTGSKIIRIIWKLSENC